MVRRIHRWALLVFLGLAPGAAAQSPADMVVDDLRSQPAALESGVPFVWTAVVRNAGDQFLECFSSASFRVNNATASEPIALQLAADQTASIGGNFTFAGRGAHVAEVQLDPLRRCNEGRRDNNALARIWTWATSADTSPPVTLLETQPPGLRGGWATSETVVSLVAIDLGSGVAETSYQLSQAVLPYAGPFSLREGVHELRFWSTDRAGNVEGAKNATLRVDITPPATLVTQDTLREGVAVRGARITLQASDALSGVAASYLRIDGRETPYTGPVTLDEAGEHRVEYWSVDVAGNSESPRPFVVAIDGPAPSPGSPPSLAVGAVLFWGLGIVLWTLATVRTIPASLTIRLAPAPEGPVDGGASNVRFELGRPRRALHAIASPLLAPLLAMAELVGRTAPPGEAGPGFGPYLADDGSLRLPRRAHIGNTFPLAVRLQPHFPPPDPQRPPDPVDVGPHDKDAFVELELMATSAFSVKGPLVQQQAVTSPLLAYQWILGFDKSADHALILVARLVRPSGTVALGSASHVVEVLRFDGLKDRHIKLFSYVAGGLGTILGLLAAADQLLR